MRSVQLFLFFATILLLLGTSTNLVDAQAAPLTSPGDGSSSSIQGILVSVSQFTNQTLIGYFVPYFYTSAEVAATTDDLLLIHQNGRTAKAFEWNIIWNYTTSESNSIRTWLASLPLRNNLEVQYTATWTAGRPAVAPSNWVFVYQSLMPYGILPSCNITRMVMNSRMALGNIPANCQTVLVPGQKQSARSTPECLIMNARTAMEIDTACRTVRAFLETLYCSDGAPGVELVCRFNSGFMPNGVPGAMVTTVGDDGWPTAGRQTEAPAPTPASAGSLYTGLVVLISFALIVLA